MKRLKRFASYLRMRSQDSLYQMFHFVRFLSGGVDSSAITAIAANAFQKEGKGSSILIRLTMKEMSNFSKQMNFSQIQMVSISRKCQIHLIRFIIIVSFHRNSWLHDLIEAVHVRDLPGMADVDSSLLWFCREIKKDFVVSLSGECADEIFGGYPWFHRLDDLNRTGFPWMRSIDERQGLLKDHWQATIKSA